MTIRRASFADTPAILALLQEMYERSPYVGIDEIDENYTKKLIVQCIQRHGLMADGGSMVLVSEHDGQVRGFVIGILDRLYHIGTKLMASDLFTYNSPSGSARDGLKLFDGLIEWAEAVPDVVEIKLGTVDVIGDFGRHAAVLERRNFTQIGEIYQRIIER